MIKIITLVGARPQIIKAAAISRAIKNYFFADICEIIVHSGQHYDANMSKVFFDELGIPNEKYNLKIGSGTHAEQTAKIMISFEQVLINENPDGLILYGDTNSTLAAALVASKLNIPIFHIEGGLRMYDKSYPEEINRRLTDHLSTLIFVPTDDGIKCLENEGFDILSDDFTIDNPKIIRTGDIMYDNAMFYSQTSNNDILARLKIQNKLFALITVHRHTLSSNHELLQNVFNALEILINEYEMYFVLPIHPRVKSILPEIKISNKLLRFLIFTEPVSYKEMLVLEQNCRIILTDSGGVQKEAYFFKKPCLVLLDNTPWVELINSGNTKICNYNTKLIVQEFNNFMNSDNLIFNELYGDGNSAVIICNEIINFFKKNNEL